MHVEWVQDEAVVLDPASGELHYLNAPAALVYASIQEFGFEEGLRQIEQSHGDAPGFAEELSKLLDDMRDKGLLVDE